MKLKISYYHSISINPSTGKNTTIASPSIIICYFVYVKKKKKNWTNYLCLTCTASTILITIHKST